MKICKKCRIEKTEDNFTLDNSRPDKLCLYCKECKNKIGLEQYQKHREKRHAYDKERYKNPDRKAKLKVWKHKSHLKIDYDLSVEQYEIMLKQTNGICPICLDELIKPDVDHNHETGKVRGIICHRCNTAIGNLGDNPETIARALRWTLQQL